MKALSVGKMAPLNMQTCVTVCVPDKYPSRIHFFNYAVFSFTDIQKYLLVYYDPLYIYCLTENEICLIKEIVLLMKKLQLPIYYPCN